MFWIYTIDDKFVTIKENRKGDKLYSIGKTKNIEKAAFFYSKKNAESWRNKINLVAMNKKVELREATLTLK
jgi:hypothetical protein